ncbi:MAG: class I SAM-dependent methyltransferase [bacterium]
MAKEPPPAKDVMITSSLLRDKAYSDNSKLDKRKALYQFTYPYYSIEDEILNLQPLSDGQCLLDVGCGTGKLILKANSVNPNGHHIGIDISDGVFGNAKDRSEKEGLNVEFQIGDAQNLSFPDKSFDRLSSMHMLYHVPNIDKAFGEFSRVIKDDGLVLITANSKESRKQLGFLKAQAGKIMGRAVFTDPNLRFNLENGPEMAAKHFTNVALLPFESTLNLTEPQPYIDYFDSLRGFWQPTPTDEQWGHVMESTRAYVEMEIANKGAFTDKTGFGIIVASHSPIPPQILERAA